MAKAKTILKFIGGVNKDRIGGNCSVIEHTDETGKTERVMFDLGAMFTPFESGFVMGFPNVDEYFDRKDTKTGQVIKALKPVSALFITHAHEDHIGALINYVKMGYILPPIKASGFTRNLIRLTFKKEGVPMPTIDKVKGGENIVVGDNVMVESVVVSHSIIDSLGFHTLTMNKGKPFASVMNNGDFLTEEQMPVGNAFNQESYLDVFKRRSAPTSAICWDSTSTNPDGAVRISFEEAVENTLNVILKNSDRNIIISPVISRSVQNIAIDIEVARQLGTKIFLDGKWLQTVKEAMDLSGYKDFDDVIYKGSLQGYLNDKRISKKYIVCTGAFAQGLENYEYNLGIDETSPIPMASATKMAMDIHPYIRLNENVLVLSRQRIIDEINGRTGPKMLQLMAAQGAVVVISPCGRKIGNFEQVPMQSSGHINAKETKNLLKKIKNVAPGIVVIPIHGNPEQCLNTKQIADSVGLESYVATNLEALELGNSQIKSVEPKLTPLTWYAVKLVMPSPYEERDIPPEGISEFWEISEDYKPIKKIAEVENTQRFRPKDAGYYKHKFDETTDLPTVEKMPKRKRIRSNSRGQHREGR